MEDLFISVEVGWNATKSPERKNNPKAETSGCPCNDCVYFDRCKKQELACDKYLAWMKTGLKSRRFTRAKRVPSKEVYLKILA